MEKEVISILDKYQGTFDMGGEYSYVYTSHEMLQKVYGEKFYIVILNHRFIIYV
jgi:hypothetical protein